MEKKELYRLLSLTDCVFPMDTPMMKVSSFFHTCTSSHQSDGHWTRTSHLNEPKGSFLWWLTTRIWFSWSKVTNLKSQYTCTGGHSVWILMKTNDFSQGVWDGPNSTKPTIENNRNQLLLHCFQNILLMFFDVVMARFRNCQVLQLAGCVQAFCCYSLVVVEKMIVSFVPQQILRLIGVQIALPELAVSLNSFGEQQ